MILDTLVQKTAQVIGHICDVESNSRAVSSGSGLGSIASFAIWMAIFKLIHCRAPKKFLSLYDHIDLLCILEVGQGESYIVSYPSLQKNSANTALPSVISRLMRVDPASDAFESRTRLPVSSMR